MPLATATRAGDVLEDRPARPAVDQAVDQAVDHGHTSTERTGPPAGWLVPARILVRGMFLSVLDVTIVTVAVPAIQKDFGCALKDVLWIATAYTLTLGVVVPLSGWLGDRFGLGRLYVISLVGFAIGSAACGLAW